MRGEKTLNSDKKALKNNKSEESRIKSIDRFRGIAVFCMIVFQFIKRVPSMGIFGRLANHGLNDSDAIKNGIEVLRNTALADFIAPMFMFAIALTYKMSYDRRVKLYGKKSVNIHFIIRNLALIGVGAIFNAVEPFVEIVSGNTMGIVDYIYSAFLIVVLLMSISTIIFNIKGIKKYKKYISKSLLYIIAFAGVMTMVFGLVDSLIKAGMVDYATLVNNGFIAQGESKIGYWVVLQSLGMAGLVALPFMALNYKMRVVAGGGLLALYSIYFYLLGGNEIILDLTQGGLLGGFGWALIIIFGSLFSEFYSKDKKQALIFVGATIALLVIMYLLLPIQKSGVKPEPTFVVVAIALSALVYAFIDLFSGINTKFDPLAWWGRYPILLYFMEFGVIGAYKMLAPTSLTTDATTSVAVISTLIVIVSFTYLVYRLNKNNKKINF